MAPLAVVKLAVEVINVVSLAIDVADKFVDVLKNAGILKITKDGDELGAKVLHGREINITPDGLSSERDYGDYMRRIDAVELPLGKSYAPEEKRAAASEFITGAMNVRYGTKIGVNEFLKEVDTHKEFYSPQRIETYMDKAQQNNLNMENIGRYLDGKLDSMQEIRQTDSVLVEAEKSMGISEEEAKERLNKEHNVRNDDKQ